MSIAARAADTSSSAGSSIAVRLADVLRDIARGGIASVLAGAVVGGVGGRLVMRVAALLNPDAKGFRTENGELIGAITANGTLALIFFGGLLGGMAAGVVWVIVSPWLPGRGRRRWLLTMPVAVALGGSFLVRSSNSDFRILEPDALLVVLLLGLIALIGLAVAWLDERLERSLPRPGTNPWPLLLAYGVVALLGSSAIPIAFDAYLGYTPSPYPPDRVGWALIAVGAVTVVWWTVRIGSGATAPPAGLRMAGRIALVAAVVLGVAQIVPEIVRIVPAD